MTAKDVVDAIHAARETGAKHGLENIHRLIDTLCPNPTVPVIHVAGTNGKGSTCAMLERILRAAGYRTGLYTSPYLQHYEERVRIGGEPLTEAQMVRYGEPLLAAAEAMKAEGLCPTPFELGTALAFSAFEGEKVDVAVVETGIGGRLDPTNFVTPVVSVITAIGLDHMKMLGDTLPAIAAEKAGIIKPSVPVVCQCAPPEVAAVFAKFSLARCAPLYQLR